MSEFSAQSYFAIRGTDGDPWLSVPRGGGALSGGSPGSASTFFVEKVGGSEGHKIRSGDYLKIRGTDGDPWLSVPRGGGNVTGGPPAGASTFVMIKETGSPGPEIRFGDYLRWRGTDGDPWLHVPRDGGQVVGGPPASASVFFIAGAEVPAGLQAAAQPTPAPQAGWTRQELGSMDVTPCVMVRWDTTSIPGVRTPTIISARQSIHLYLDTNIPNLNAALEAVIRECAVTAVLAAGIGSLIASPLAAFGVFWNAFWPCVSARAAAAVAGVTPDMVRLNTETKCHW
jgi:hypothetical protein